MLWLEIRDPNVKVDMDIRIRVGAEQGRLELAGVVYGGEGHFTARIIDAEGETLLRQDRYGKLGESSRQVGVFYG